METAGLTELLKQEGSYTMFAPTDEAFEKVNKGDLELLKGECCQKIKKSFCSPCSTSLNWQIVKKKL